MTELEILRGIAIFFALSKFVVPVMIIWCISEWWDKRSQAKTKKEIEKRRAEFNRECERVGKRMHNIDEIHRTVTEFAV